MKLVETVLGYHFCGDTLRDGRPIPADGEWLVHEGEITPCKSGLHMSVEPFDALTYAPGPLLCRVELEGGIKMVGNLSTSWVDMLLIARRELALGASQTRIREQFGDSNGVKLYMMCLLNSKYPEVRIIERATLPPEDPDWIPVQSVKYPILQGMAQRFDAQSTDAYNKRNANKKKPILSGEEVMAYFSNVKKNPEGDGGPKAMDRNAKFVGRRRRILWRKDITDLLRRFAADQALSVAHLWEMPDVVREYLTTLNPNLREAARSELGSRVGSAAWYASGYTVWRVTQTAAWSSGSAAQNEFNRRVYEMSA